MNKETRATLEIIIREIQDLFPKDPMSEKEAWQSIDNIDKLLQTWINANKLHPEEVIHINGAYGRKQE